MNGQTLGFAIIGSIFLLIAFLAYIATLIATVSTCLLIMTMIQGKFPIITQKSILLTLLYAMLWAVLGTVVILYTCILLVPAYAGLDGLGDIGGTLSETGAADAVVKTAIELFIIALGVGIKPNAYSGKSKVFRLVAVISCLGIVEGVYAFEFRELISVFFSMPTSTLEAVAQGIASGFLVPLEMLILFSSDDFELRRLIMSKYEVNPFNPYSYMNWVSVMVWCWAVFSFVFAIKPDLTALVDKIGSSEDEFWDGISIFVVTFIVCNFVVFYLIYLLNYESHHGWSVEPGAMEIIIGLFCLLGFIPALIIMVIQLIMAPFALLAASASPLPARVVKIEKPPRTGFARKAENQFSAPTSKSIEPVKTTAKITEPTPFDTLNFDSNLLVDASLQSDTSDINTTKSNVEASPERLESKPKINLSGLSRNAICPCGSGKRVKHCHGRFDVLNVGR